MFYGCQGNVRKLTTNHEKILSRKTVLLEDCCVSHDSHQHIVNEYLMSGHLSAYSWMLRWLSHQHVVLAVFLVCLSQVPVTTYLTILEICGSPLTF